MIINIHIDSQRKRFDAIGVPVPVPGLESKVEKCCVSGSLQVSFFVKVGRLLGKRCCDLSSPSVSQSLPQSACLPLCLRERRGSRRGRDGGGEREILFPFQCVSQVLSVYVLSSRPFIFFRIFMSTSL